MRPDHDMEEHKAYLLQCIRLGMLLERPEDLEGMEDWHFADPVLRDVATELKERRKTVTDGGKLKNGPTLLTALLVEFGCEEGIGSVEDAKSAIRDRVEAMGGFVRALAHLDKLVHVTVENRNLSNTELRRFSEAVTNGIRGAER